MIHDGFRADLVEELRDFDRVVVVVDVVRHCPRAVCAEHGLDVLGAVRKQDRDGALPALPTLQLRTLTPHAEAVRDEERAEMLRAFLHLGVGAPHGRPDQHLPVGHRRGDRVDHGRKGPVGRHRPARYQNI